MNSHFNSRLISLSLTALLLIVLEIIATALIPALGFHDFLLPFNVLFVLFLAFRVSTPALPFFILIIQIFHNIFSIENWAHGTLSGLAISLGINYLKNIINFTTVISTMVITFIAMLSWYVMTSFFLYVSVKNLNLILNRLWGSLPECFIIALISPCFFIILNQIWKVDLKHRADV